MTPRRRHRCPDDGGRVWRGVAERCAVGLGRVDGQIVTAGRARRLERSVATTTVDGIRAALAIADSSSLRRREAQRRVVD